MPPEIEVQMIKLSQLRESPTNPRKLFGDLSELAASIKTQGILQPLSARPVAGGHFELIYGHRRFRAARLAGLKEVPVIVRDMTDVEVLEAQVTENLLRDDVHPLELAAGYQALMDKGLTAEQVAARLGISRRSIFNVLILLRLTDEPRKEFLAGKLTQYAAMAIAKVDGERLQKSVTSAVLAASKDGPLPVRAVDRLIKSRFEGGKKPKGPASSSTEEAEETDKQREAIARRATSLLLTRVGETVTRRSLGDADLRLMLLALAELNPAIEGLLTERRATARYLPKVPGAQLRALLVEAVLLLWVTPGSEAEKVVAKAYGLDLREMSTTAKALLTAEGLFEK